MNWLVDKDLFSDLNLGLLEVFDDSFRINHSGILTERIVSSIHPLKYFRLSSVSDFRLVFHNLQDNEFTACNLPCFFRFPAYCFANKVKNAKDFFGQPHYECVVVPREQRCVANNLNFPLVLGK